MNCAVCSLRDSSGDVDDRLVAAFVFARMTKHPYRDLCELHAKGVAACVIAVLAPDLAEPPKSVS